MTELRRRTLLGGTAAVLAAPAIIGRAQAAEAKGDLVVGVPDNLITLDPADANDTLSQGVCRLMLAGPVRLRQGHEDRAAARRERERERARDGVHFQAAPGRQVP